MTSSILASITATVLAWAAADPAMPSASTPTSSSGTEIFVAAAADLQPAFEEIGKAFEAEGGGKLSFTFGASGVLTRQLRAGAPFDVFAAANASFVDEAIRAGACDASTRTLYARGHLVVWSRKDGRVRAPTTLADVAGPRFAHIAIANPATAPYGMAAKEALTSAGLWDRVSPRLVLGENVRQTLQLAQTGNADVAIVALSLAIPTSAQGPNGTWFPIDESLHAPLDQAIVVCTRGENRAGGEVFVRYVASKKGRSILERFGFAVPGSGGATTRATTRAPTRATTRAPTSATTSAADGPTTTESAKP